jgi:hypothetical protein
VGVRWAAIPTAAVVIDVDGSSSHVIDVDGIADCDCGHVCCICGDSTHRVPCHVVKKHASLLLLLLLLLLPVVPPLLVLLL